MISFAEETDNEHITTVPDGYVGIYTKDDLDNIKLNLSGKYILMNDIVFTEEDYAEGGSFYNSGKGWSPIGSSSSPFRGIFNGNGYSIINIKINNPSGDYKGLFASAKEATLENISLLNAEISGNNYIGGICGYLVGQSTISNCFVSGYISGNKYVGGICGYVFNETYNYKDYVFNTIISGNNNVANIVGVKNVGGIVGLSVTSETSSVYYVMIYSYVNISKCVNTGNISGDSNIGGILGHSYTKSNTATTNTSVWNCLNVGYILSDINYAGGIVGLNGSCGNNLSTGIISSVGAYGPINGDSNSTGGSNYYLNTIVSLPSNSYGTEKSHDQMIKQTTYEGWDFNTVWTMDGREDYPYPELRDVPLIFPDELNHEHEYSSEITTPATHLAEGVMTYTCSCGDTYTEAIVKTTEHTYNTIVTAPTCTDRGFTMYYCACNDFYMADYVAANGHSHTAELTTPATHLTEGVMTYTCSCGDTYTEAIAKTTEHTYNAVVTPPTCTAQGYTTYTCVCGDTYVSDYVKENGHSHTATVTTPATHLTEGLMTYTCACGDTYTEVIAKTTEHTFTEEIIATPTCTAKGEKLFTCECGYTYTEEIAKTNHINTNGDFACDICGNNLCSHMCHKSGFMGFIWKLINFFSKLFGTNPVCECGVAHY